MIKNFIKSILKYKSLPAAQYELRVWKKGFVPPGHYYSAIPDEACINKGTIDYKTIIPGVDLNEPFQLQLLEKLKLFYTPGLFPETKQENCRYYFDNDYFGYSDGICLHSLMMEYKPKRIVEIGSGFSSALMLETNDKYFNGQIELTFIEPYPEERLLQLIRESETNLVVKDFVQNTSDDIWDSLEENDILFIDSSHVSKYGSDVNHLFFYVLPRLKPGVIIHIHDVFFPFEYPFEWLKQGRSWTEAYLLRSFLQYNDHFEIILFPSLLEGKYRPWYELNMPLCLKTHKTIEVNGVMNTIETTGQSIYIRKRKH
ncbi:MAG: class I SAM-dependent methyltransferase [Bacteroidota bacterium]